MLFVDRIEIHSEEKTVSKNGKLRIERDVWAEVKFKFNPKKFPEVKQGVEPKKQVMDSIKSESEPKNQETGAAFED